MEGSDSHTLMQLGCHRESALYHKYSNKVYVTFAIMKVFLIIGSILLIAALVPTINAEDGTMEGGGDKTMTRKQKKKMQKMKHNKGGSSKAGKGSDPGGHPHTDVNMCYFADPTYTQGTALEDLLGSGFTYTHAKAVNDQYRDLVTQWDMGEITAEFVHGEGKDIGMVHAGLDVTGELICTFTDPGDIVIDPVAGSGSTLIAAINTDRNPIGFEINKDFYNKAKEWIDFTIDVKKELSENNGFSQAFSNMKTPNQRLLFC